MARRIAAVTAAYSSSVRLIVRMACNSPQHRRVAVRASDARGPPSSVAVKEGVRSHWASFSP
jgi:hypothetical protein